MYLLNQRKFPLVRSRNWFFPVLHTALNKVMTSECIEGFDWFTSGFILKNNSISKIFFRGSSSGAKTCSFIPFYRKMVTVFENIHRNTAFSHKNITTLNSATNMFHQCVRLRISTSLGDDFGAIYFFK